MKTYRIEITCEQDGEKLFLREKVPGAVAKMLAEADDLDAAIIHQTIVDAFQGSDGFNG